MRRANIVSGVVLVLLGLFALAVIIPNGIGRGPDGMMSPSLVPNMMMGVVVVLSAFLVFSNLRAKPSPDDDELPIARGELLALTRIGAIFLISIALFLLLSPLAGGVFLVAASLLLLGERRPLVIIGMTAGLLIAVWLLFYKVLGTGIL
ncbi:tripartite tricarboxylate transporter TctB family protein [Martelella soudanensis]|uniref:tripartite tricarboxylate transporter TctB family protein n=1 Tax=unclassified Martelella TaxID=2629616 RepID=UPI0015DEFF5B|nr:MULTISPECIES: tripartite tricarboxylate transporter TctB family protein [unclassified Martelella]